MVETTLQLSEITLLFMILGGLINLLGNGCSEYWVIYIRSL